MYQRYGDQSSDTTQIQTTDDAPIQSVLEPEDYRWMTNADASWLESDWAISHLIVAIFLFMFLTMPFVLFIILKINSEREFKKKKEENEKLGCELSDCNRIWEAKHLGSHPLLPLEKFVLLGTDYYDGLLKFMDYRLDQYQVIPLDQVKLRTESRNISATTITSPYATKKSGVGSTVGTVGSTVQADTVIMILPVNDQMIQAEFDFRPNNPMEFIHEINKILSKKNSQNSDKTPV